jgi:acetyltransferase-like isoleucine patch superfamily enzyme
VNTVDTVPWGQILERLDSAQANLGAATKDAIVALWPIAVRRQYISGVGLTLLGALFVIGAFCFFWVAYRMRHNDNVAYGASFVGALASVLGAVILSKSIMLLLSPHWYAIVSVAELVKRVR